MDPRLFSDSIVKLVSDDLVKEDQHRSKLSQCIVERLNIWHSIADRPLTLLLPKESSKENVLTVRFPKQYSSEGAIDISYAIEGLEAYSKNELEHIFIHVTLNFGGVDESVPKHPVIGWVNRYLTLQTSLSSGAGPYVLSIPLMEVCTPESSWKEADFYQMHEGDVFPSRSMQQLEAQMTVLYKKNPISSAETSIDIGNLRSLYFLKGLQSYVYRNLSQIPLFDTLTEDDLNYIISTSYPISLKARERVISQGAKGSSLFIALYGHLEAFVYGKNKELFIGSIQRGESFGEISFLTGAARSATVYAAAEGAIVLEISKERYQKVLDAHPELVIALAKTMKDHLSKQKELDMKLSISEPKSFCARIRTFFFR